MSTPADRSYVNAGREREALIASIGQKAYDQMRRAERDERANRKPRANRADHRRRRPAGYGTKLRTPPAHPLSIQSTIERQARQAAEQGA